MDRFLQFFSQPTDAELRRFIEEGEPFALIGLAVAEVLQGLTINARRIEQHFAHWEMLEPSALPRSGAPSTEQRAKGIIPTKH